MLAWNVCWPAWPRQRPRLVIIAVALVARAMLGWVPLIGGLIGFVLLLVVLFQVALIAMNMIRTTSSRA
ncbi:MAG: hypothetical protein R2749_17745 [Acidimicrobiales bacterium]